ncbi:MAG TPA: hypothetical protein VHC86_01345 [Opitutaceae bacterium]|nr:hypothetical protein [Opitutaceae bacterium]
MISLMAYGKGIFTAGSKPPIPAPAEAAHHDQTPAERVKSESNAHPDAPGAITTAIDKLDLTVQQQIEEEKRDYSQRKAPSEWWAIIPTIVIALSAVIQVVIYWRQTRVAEAGLEETRRANIAARTALEAAERAEMQLTGLRLPPTSQFIPNAFLEVSYKNVGRTAATEVVVHVRKWSGNEPANEGGIKSPPSYVGAGTQGFYRIDINRIDHAYNQDELARFNDGGNPFNVTVELSYTDAFQKPWVVIYGVGWSAPEREFGFKVIRPPHHPE